MYDLIVLGGGPAGYNAAERAAHSGMKTLVLEGRALGGVCLNEGCVPTKTLLYSAKIFDYAKHGADYGVKTENASIDHSFVVARKDKVVKTLVSGIQMKLKKAGVEVVSEYGKIAGKIDGGFAADGRVYRGKQSGGYLNVIYPAHIHACDKSRNVADHAAAESQNYVGAGEPFFRQPFQNFARRFPVFAGFAVRNGVRFRVVGQRGFQFVEPKGGNVVVGDDGDFLACDVFARNFGKTAEQSFARYYGIICRGSSDYGFHSSSFCASKFQNTHFIVAKRTINIALW